MSDDDDFTDLDDPQQRRRAERMGEAVAAHLESYSRDAENRALREEMTRREIEHFKTRRTRQVPTEEQQYRQAMSDLYGGMARAVSTLAVYGGYDDIETLMAEYNPAELSSPQLAEFLELANLELAQRYITAMIEWRKK
jgi:hypothetical protein